MPRTYGDLSKAEINAMIDSPQFPAWLAKAEANYARYNEIMSKAIDAEISADMKRIAERFKQEAL